MNIHPPPPINALATALVSPSQVSGVRCKSVGKCFDEEYVKPVDIDGVKLNLALLESQMNNVVNSGLAGHFDCIIKRRFFRKSSIFGKKRSKLSDKVCGRKSLGRHYIFKQVF